MGPFDDKEVTIRCPGCTEPITQKVAWLKEDGHVCPNCDAINEAERFRRIIEHADREWSDSSVIVPEHL